MTKPIQPGIYYTQAILAGSSYGLTFDPLVAGTTTVTVTSPSATTMTTAGVRTINISSPGITMSATHTIGARLQSTNSATLGASQHGGVTVTVTSSAPGVVLVAPNSTTAGAPSFPLTLANGETSVPIWIQGMENATGTAIVTVSAPGFVSATTAVTVVASAVEIQALTLTTTAGAASDTSWYVQTGIPNAGGTALSSVKNVRAGGPAFIVTLTNSNATVAQLSSDEPATTGATVTKPIQQGIYYTQAIVAGTTYGLTFNPVAAGSTTVTVTGPTGVLTMSSTGVRTVAIGASVTPDVSIVATDPIADEAGANRYFTIHAQAATCRSRSRV